MLQNASASEAREESTLGSLKHGARTLRARRTFWKQLLYTPKCELGCKRRSILLLHVMKQAPHMSRGKISWDRDGCVDGRFGLGLD